MFRPRYCTVICVIDLVNYASPSFGRSSRRKIFDRDLVHDTVYYCCGHSGCGRALEYLFNCRTSSVSQYFSFAGVQAVYVGVVIYVQNFDGVPVSVFIFAVFTFAVVITFAIAGCNRNGLHSESGNRVSTVKYRQGSAMSQPFTVVRSLFLGQSHSPGVGNDFSMYCNRLRT